MLAACGLWCGGVKWNWNEAGSMSECAVGSGGVASVCKVWCSCDGKGVAVE